jgi:hypothetical protein
MKTIILGLFILFIFGCKQKDEVLYKKVDSTNLQLKIIYQLIESQKIGKIDSLPKGDYNVLIWKKTK